MRFDIINSTELHQANHYERQWFAFFINFNIEVARDSAFPVGQVSLAPSPGSAHHELSDRLSLHRR